MIAQKLWSNGDLRRSENNNKPYFTDFKQFMSTWSDLRLSKDTQGQAISHDCSNHSENTLLCHFQHCLSSDIICDYTIYPWNITTVILFCSLTKICEGKDETHCVPKMLFRHKLTKRFLYHFGCSFCRESRDMEIIQDKPIAIEPPRSRRKTTFNNNQLRPSTSITT